MKKLDKRKMNSGVEFYDPDERMGLLICHRDNKQARLQSQRLTAPYAASLRRPGPAMFKTMEKIENQVLAKNVWKMGWYLDDEGYQMHLDGAEFDELEGHWIQGSIIDDEGNLLPVETEEQRLALLEDDAYLELKETIEARMRDRTRFGIDPKDAGAEAGKS